MEEGIRKGGIILKLQMGYFNIEDIVFGDKCGLKDGLLTIEKAAIEKLVLEDEKLKSVTVDIARPGESVRITPVKDVIEPRTKVEGKGGIFPGVMAGVDTVGSGKTYALKGMAVVTAGRIVGFQEGMIDMTGPGAQYSPFSQLLNLVLVCEPIADLERHEYEKAVRLAGFRVATFIGDLAKELLPDAVQEFETLPIMEGKDAFPDLPRVA